MAPTPYVAESRLRVLFASCDADMRGRVFAAEFSTEPPFALMGVAAEPVLDLGADDAFDCDGVNPSQVIEIDGELLLFYIGWRRGPPEAPYSLLAGLARSSDGGRSFIKDPKPLLAPVDGERLIRTAPFVTPCADGYQLHYIGGDAFFDSAEGKRLPTYSLRRLRSARADRWEGAGEVLLSPDAARGEIGFGRPVLLGEQFDRMMISVRTEGGYELMEGRAPQTADARPLLRQVFDPPFESWEREMRCFGAVCVVGDHELLFYNGDGFGRTGAGLAWRPRR